MKGTGTRYTIPWIRCEEILSKIAKANANNSSLIFARPSAVWARKFLRELGFIEAENSRLTDVGKEYYLKRFITEEEIEAKNILANRLKKLPITQAICQVLWGKKNISRKNVYNLLVINGFIDPDELSEDRIGSFLMLLNYCSLIKYSKKTGNVLITYNPKSEAEGPLQDVFLAPETPYSNVKALREIIRNCVKEIHWFDKHFSKKGFEILSEEADANKITNVKILSGPDNVNDGMKKDYERLKLELSNRGINIEIRIVDDKEFLQRIHDRWIISEGLCYNVPPVNTIFQGQYAELKKSTNLPPFGDWWAKGKSI